MDSNKPACAYQMSGAYVERQYVGFLIQKLVLKVATARHFTDSVGICRYIG